MNLLVTGATGFIGRPLTSALAAAGHSLRALTRNPDVSQGRLPTGVRAFAWSGKGRIPGEAMDGVDAVVHLAGESIGAWPWSAERKRRILESRVLGTRAVVEAMERAGARPRSFIAGAALGYYGNGGDRALGETAEAGGDFLAGVCVAWEREIFKAEALGVRTVAVRSGLVLGPGGVLGKMGLAFRLGLGPVIGSGGQFWSWIDLRDTVGIFLHALEHEDLRGPVNACAPDPARQREFARELAAAMHRPRIVSVPAWALRLALGEMASTLLEGQRGDAGKILAAGYRFRFPHLRSALEDILSGKSENPSHTP